MALGWRFVRPRGIDEYRNIAAAPTRARRMTESLDVLRDCESLGALESSGPIQPPFDFNSPGVAKFSPEVTGRILLKSLCRRLQWPSLAGRRLLDFGCGVRLASTLVNLEIAIARYVGID